MNGLDKPLQTYDFQFNSIRILLGLNVAFLPNKIAERKRRVNSHSSKHNVFSIIMNKIRHM